ncbi:dihydropteroate synthase, partial [Halobacterium salinarum]|nr:dihydropteroate synthase [Halobacterium salinarum]
MRYDEAANFLLDLRRYGPKPGTESTADLLASLGDPHQDGPDYVQIAGSNGKGSTARFTESILRAAGLDVGLYTSPHFDDVRERVTVNGRRMSKAALTTFIETITPYVTERAADGAAPTYFEVVTAMALWQFSRADVDVAVLEVGIGGRLD